MTGWLAELSLEENMPNIPNLDAMTQQELWDFWKRYARPKRADALELVGPRKGYTVISGALAGYASNKATAMGCRERGDISGALAYEGIADSIYSELPSDCKW